MKKLLTIVWIWLSICVQVQSQDLHYSQHVNNPLYYNPALTGFIQQKARINLMYADRYRQAYSSGGMKTSFGSADMNFSLGGPNRRSFFGIGAYFYHHRRGINAVVDNVAAISAAYRLLLDEKYKHSLSLGFNVSLWNRALNIKDLQFGSQYNGMMYDPGQISGENLSFAPQNNMNAATGIVYTYDSKDVFKGYIGFSVLNLYPDPLRIDRTYLPMRYNIHSGLSFDLGKTSLAPSLMIDYQQDAMEFYTGIMANYSVVNSKTLSVEFFAGPYLRMYKNPVGDFSLYTVNLVTGIDANDWQIMFSVDNTLGSAKTALGGFTGFELSLQYAFGQSLPKNTPIYCPTFR
jgi:type IX secretion system PorP/SprF family membrane protein